MLPVKMSEWDGEGRSGERTTDANIPIMKLSSPSRSDLRSAFEETDDEDNVVITPLAPVTPFTEHELIPGPSGYVSSSQSVDDGVFGEDLDWEEPESLGEGSVSDIQEQLVSSDPAEEQRQRENLNRYLNKEISFVEYAQLADRDSTSEDLTGETIATETCCPTDSVINSASVEAFEKELIAKPRLRRRKRILPPALQGLMGEANLTYARGDHATAEKMCLEIIRQCPNDPEAFNTLAHLYEEQGLPDKSLQVALIAALLSPGDPNQWIRLALMSEEQGNLKQAIQCYTRAIRADPSNVETHMKRAALLEQAKDHKSAIKCYTRLLSVLTPDHGPLILELAKKISYSHHKDGDLARAREAMEIAFLKVPNEVQSEDVNLLLDLLLQLQDYPRCLEVMISHCGVEVTTEQTGDSDPVVASCNFPEHIPMDLWAKLAVVLIHLRTLHLVDDLIDYLLQRVDCEIAGDLYLDVAEALMAVNRHKDALRLLRPLVESKNYSLAAVWLRQAECLRVCGLTEEAVEAYEQVVEQAPQHVDVRVTLSSLLTSLGREEEAISVLTQDADREVLDPGLLFKRASLLQEGGLERAEEFLAVGQLLLSRHCVRIRNREELDALCRLRRIDKKNIALKEIRDLRGEAQQDQDAPEFTYGEREPSIKEEWNLLRELCETCLRLGRFGQLERLALSALGSKRFYTAAMAAETEFLSLLACLHNGDAYYGYNLARDLVVREVHSPRAWNLFNLVIQRADDVRHNRFIMRFLSRHANHTALTILHANNCLVAGTYKYALNEYAAAFRREESPMLAFLMGVTLIQMACQKFSAKKHSLVTQGVAFLWQYKDLRGPCGLQEVYYNIGRAFHQLGLLPAAAHHYKLVLESTPPDEPMLDLCQEAAFNLHLIYINAGCIDLAQMYLDKYVVV